MCNNDNRYLIGIDIGTSAVKGILMAADGNIIDKQRISLSYNKETDKKVELDAGMLYLKVAQLIRCMVGCLPESGEVKGISIASASGNTLLIDEDCRPMTSAISWMDTRVTDEVEQVFGKLIPEDVGNTVGWPLIDMFPLAHLSWFKVHDPQLLKRANRVCMTTDYILYRLTDKWGIDNSTATTFYLQEQVKGVWNKKYLSALGIPEDKLPILYKPGYLLGEITDEAEKETGLKKGTAVVLGAFDHPSAARGSGVLEEGEMLLSCGTSWVGFLPIADRNKALKMKMSIDPFLEPDGPWGAIFSLPAIAIKLDELISTWISDAKERYSIFDKLASQSDPGAGGLFINPLASDTCDLSCYEKKYIARAIMESVVFLLKLKINALSDNGIDIKSITMVGGPSESNTWPQIVSDVLGVDINSSHGAYSGAVGAAAIAGIGSGAYKDIYSAKQILKVEGGVFKSDSIKNNVYNAIYKDYIAKIKLED